MANITLGQTINESLSTTDTKNPQLSGSFSDDYTLSEFSNWQQVQVNLDSTAIDSYLQLVNASTGKVIAENDDSGGSRNSQLSFTKLPGVNYILRATSANSGATGNYTIKTSSLGTASSLVVTRNGQEAGTVDPLGRFVKIGNFVDAGSSSEFGDIAFSNDNKLLGIKRDTLPTQLYSIDPDSGSSSVIGNFPFGVQMAALEFLPNGTLYGASRSNSSNSSKLYTVNPQNGTASSIADFPWAQDLGGDIVFEPVKKEFLFANSSVSTSTSTLFSVSLTGQSTKIGDIGFDNVNGLSLEGNTLVGFTGDKKRIKIDPATGKGTFDRDITGINSSDVISGAGSIPSTTRTQAPTSPTTPPATNNTGGAAKSIYNPKDINKDYPDTNPVSKATIRILQLDQDGKPAQNPTQLVENKETYVVIHGFNNDSQTPTIANLAKQIGSAKDQGGEGKQVILIDWKDAAKAGAPAQPGQASKWISDVAAFASDVLKRIWKIDNANINLIGHSLGSLVADEIGLYLGTEEDKDVLNSEYRKNPNIDPAKRVNTLIALDPPGDLSSLTTASLFDGYDLSQAAGTQSPVDFNKVSNFSRAFWGYNLLGNGLGSRSLAHTAQESFEIKFTDVTTANPIDAISSHGNIINLFKNMLANKDERISALFQLDKRDHNFKANAYNDGDEGIILAQKGSKMKDGDGFEIQPVVVIAKSSNISKNDDDIVYGGRGNDVLAPYECSGIFEARCAGTIEQFTNEGNDIVYGDKGNDLIAAGQDNDTLFGDRGNDTIYGEADNDILFGGKDDDFLSGDNGNDTLIGGLGADNLDGGYNDDVLIGGKDKDMLTGGFGSDTFVFSSGEGTSSRDDADIITDFGTGANGFLSFFGLGGADRIALAGSLKADMIDLEPFNNGGARTALKAKVNGTTEYLAVLNGNFSRDDLKLQENFLIPTIS